MKSFSLVITSDPQYPWYDTYDAVTYGYPPGVTGEPQIEANSLAQIKGQYTSINQLAQQRGAQPNARPVQAVIINGDLTASGEDTELPVWKAAAATLSVDMYPALGNHDYSNLVNDSFNNNRASRMVGYMWGWLQNNRTKLGSIDFAEKSGGLPLGSATYSGSLAYSFNLGPVHVVMLQNYPFYRKSWFVNIATGGTKNYDIAPSFDWLMTDLERARAHGDAILVFTTHTTTLIVSRPAPTWISSSN